MQVLGVSSLQRIKLHNIVWMVPLHILQGLQVIIFEITLPFFPLRFFFTLENSADSPRNRFVLFFCTPLGCYGKEIRFDQFIYTARRSSDV